MSIPNIPGYIEEPTPGCLNDLWPRPEGEYPDELWPSEILAAIDASPTGWLIVEEHRSNEEGSIGRGCVLVDADDAAAALDEASWTGRDLGTFSIWDDLRGGGGFEDGLRTSEEGPGLHFFVQVKRPVGSPEPVLDITQPFLWYFDAYPVRDGWAYLNEAGRPQELVRVRMEREYWTVEVRALEFRQFLHTCGRHAVLQVDCTPRTATEGFARAEDELRLEWATFSFVATSERSFASSGGFSRLLGQYLVRGTSTSRKPRMQERREDVQYPEFIYGVDSATGQPLLHSCDPDALGTYFDPDNSRLHYLTPVYFKREVLLPYAQEPSRYRLTRTRLECLNLWGLSISFNTAGLVEVYLGDLGRDLPSDEWNRWRACNVIPEGKMEEGRFRRDFLNQSARTPDLPGELRRARSAAATATERAFGAPVWRPLDEATAAEYESLIGPLTDDQAALQGPLILLAKCFVDAIDPAPLKAFLGDVQPGEQGLSLLARSAERLGGATDDVEGLRALYDVRSAGGVAHLAGRRREKAFARLGIEGMSPMEAFDHTAVRILETLERFTLLVGAAR